MSFLLYFTAIFMVPAPLNLQTACLHATDRCSYLYFAYITNAEVTQPTFHSVHFTTVSRSQNQHSYSRTLNVIFSLSISLTKVLNVLFFHRMTSTRCAPCATPRRTCSWCALAWYRQPLSTMCGRSGCRSCVSITLAHPSCWWGLRATSGQM